MHHKRFIAAITLLTMTATVLFSPISTRADEAVDSSLSAETEEVVFAEDKLPAAGVAVTLEEGADYIGVSEITEEVEEEENFAPIGIPSAVEEILNRENREMVPNAVCVVGDYVFLRSGTEEHPDNVGTLYRNSVAEILGEEGDDYYVLSGNVYGYVRKDFLLTGDEAKPLIEEATVRTAKANTDNLCVRTAPDLNATELMILPAGEEMVVLEQDGNWAKVSLEDTEGYVYCPYVDIETGYVTALTDREISGQEREALRNEMEARALQNIAYDAANGAPSHFVSRDGGSEQGRAVAEFAVQFVGNPYVWGGSSLTEGADCSGFVMAVYKEFGVTLTHSTEIDQTEGVAVPSIEEAQPGDIVCYQGHVGIYIGDGMLCHAAGVSKGIIITMACYDNIITIRRIFND